MLLCWNCEIQKRGNFEAGRATGAVFLTLGRESTKNPRDGFFSIFLFFPLRTEAHEHGPAPVTATGNLGPDDPAPFPASVCTASGIAPSDVSAGGEEGAENLLDQGNGTSPRGSGIDVAADV